MDDPFAGAVYRDVKGLQGLGGWEPGLLAPELPIGFVLRGNLGRREGVEHVFSTWQGKHVAGGLAAGQDVDRFAAGRPVAQRTSKTGQAARCTIRWATPPRSTSLTREPRSPTTIRVAP